MNSTHQRSTARAHPDTTAPIVAVYVGSARSDSTPPVQARAAALQASTAEGGWTVSAVLIEARSWDISHSMLEALTAFDVVLVDGLSQLTRDASRVVEVLKHLAAAEVRVVLATAGTSAGAVSGQETSPVVRALMTAVAEAARVAQRRAHSRRVKAGMAAARARRGKRR